MNQQITIIEYQDLNTEEFYTFVKHIYLTSKFMSDDFDRKFSGIKQFEEYHTNLLKVPGSLLLVATYNNSPVGYIAIEANPATRLRHTAYLSMGVGKSYRGKGVGRQLVQAAMEKSTLINSIEIIYLMVRSDHVGAIKLYEKTGFEKVAILEKDTKIGNQYYDGVLMRKFV